ncbi:MAG: hypothetical protein K8R31_00895 [Bacteroidales bacterium]|nr:hypothetical protein [Bacteroidales bacterium]
MSVRKKILICPLNWGLGHATRDVPVIRLFVKHNFEVIIAASGDTYRFLDKEFPELKFINFSGYNVHYSKSGSQILKMLLLIPRILLWTIKEHRELKKIVKEHNIDIVFSDNRFGLWSRNTYNIFMTHQLKVKFPGLLNFLEPIYQHISTVIIKRYNECWIPDFEGEVSLAGELSHIKTKLRNSYFIGPVSRFTNNKLEYPGKKIDVLFLLSGPEPQRSIFEKIIYEQTKKLDLQFVIVRGTSEECNNTFKFPVYNIINTEELIPLITKSEIIICRSGYSSVMDLFLLKKKTVLVPTPGQTEQEYLAKYLMERRFFYSVSQRNFNLDKLVNEAFDFPDIQIQKPNMLEERIIKLKEKYNH